MKYKFVKSNLKKTLEMCLYNTFCKVYILILGRRDDRNLKYKISLCLIFKNEAKFLKEWIDYHMAVGVSHFYLYNNGSDDNYKEVLYPYIKCGYVTLIDFPEPNAQFKAYRHCYAHYRGESNWISFLDVDEFICPKYDTDICSWIKRFEKYPAINIHWLVFCTSGVLNHDYSKNVIEQYHVCWEDFWTHGKCFVNTRFDIANFDTWYVHHHTYMYYFFFGIRIKLPAVNQFGYICTVDKTWGGGKNKRMNSTIQINHYFTKAWDIWESKMKKTDVLFSKNPKSDIQYFYKYEMKGTSCDYTINRFLIKMKIRQNIISSNLMME